jgi:hypothetical protein
MSEGSEKFQSLSDKFEVLVQNLNDSRSREDRLKLLRRMRILVSKIDGLIFSALHVEKEDAKNSSGPPSVRYD